MPHNTPHFAIEIHAKMLVRRFKHHAKIEAVCHAERLKQQGDHEGHQVWTDVANKIEAMQPDHNRIENNPQDLTTGQSTSGP
jgi:hypothetical protein